VASRQVEENNLKSKRLRRVRRVRLLFRAKGLKEHDVSLARLLSRSITRIFARSPDSPTPELREIFDHIFPDISRDRHIFTDFQRLTQPLFHFTCVACSITVSGPTVPASDRGRLNSVGTFHVIAGLRYLQRSIAPRLCESRPSGVSMGSPSLP
jgi:hypothetical protein